jgi:hypothetical protein
MSYEYYTQEKMTNRKLSDLSNDQYFLDDAVTFLKSSRKGYTDEDFQGLKGRDVVNQVLEHFRIMNTNEVTMGRDFYYMEDSQTPEEERQAYARLMFAFDNAQGEGWLDQGGLAKVGDYAEGIATAPSTYASVAAIPLTAGTGAVAVQAGKIGTQQALKALGKKVLKRSLMGAALEGSVAASSQLGQEIIKKRAGETIGEDYEVSGTNVAMAGGIGGIAGGIGTFLPMAGMKRQAKGMIDTIEKGDLARKAEIADASNRAKERLKELAQSNKASDKKLFQFTQGKIMAAIDPELVDEGMNVKVNIMSDDLPDGQIGGFSRDLMYRLSAASADLAMAIKSKNPDFTAAPGQRITEFLARMQDSGQDPSGIFTSIAKEYGLSKRQLSAVYAAEVSEAAKLLRQQQTWISMSGKKYEGKEAAEMAKQYTDKLDQLWDEGLSALTTQDAAELAEAAGNMKLGGKIYHTARGLEDLRRAFMTSQPATTIRNNVFGIANSLVDTVDTMFEAAVKAVRGRSDASTTFQGTADMLAYLTKDATVAETVVTMLSEQAPEKLGRVFMEAAQAEAGLRTNTRLSKVGHLVNAMNTASDHVFKKAVIATELNRALRNKGTSLREVMEQGKLADESVVSDQMLTDALDRALEFTFQNRFGGKNASDTSKFVNKAIGFTHRNFLTSLIPFPRYIAAQAKYIKDYSVLNVIYKGGLGNMTDREIAKTITGSAGLAGAYMVQQQNALADRNWHDAESETGVYNAQAAMGPTAPMHYVMAQMARAQEGLPNDFEETGKLATNLTKLLIGTEFRPGGTFVDEGLAVVQSISDGEPNLQPIMKVFGDYFSTVTYPAAVLKDLYGQFDPRSSYLPDTLDATVALHDMYGGTSTYVALYQRIAKNIPDVNMANMVNTLREDLGIEVTEPEMEGFFKYMGGTARTQFQLQDPLNIDEGYDVVRYDIFGAGPLRVLDPFLKQLTGFSKAPPRTALQRELVRLNLDPFKIYNPYQQKNTALEYAVQMDMQGTLAVMAEQLIEGSTYQGLDVEAQKGVLTGFIKDMMNARRTATREAFIERAKAGVGTEDYYAYIRGEYKALGSGKKKQDADIAFKAITSKEFSEQFRLELPDASVEDAREYIKSLDHYTTEEKKILDYELLRKYMANGPLWAKVRNNPTDYFK